MSKWLRDWFIGQWTGRRCQCNYTEWTIEQYTSNTWAWTVDTR